MSEQALAPMDDIDFSDLREGDVLRFVIDELREYYLTGAEVERAINKLLDDLHRLGFTTNVSQPLERQDVLHITLRKSGHERTQALAGGTIDRAASLRAE